MSPQFRLLLLFLVTLCAGVGIGYVASHQPATAEARSPTVAPARPNNPPRPQWTKQEVTLVASFIKPYPGAKNPAEDYQNVLGSEAAWAQAIEASATRFAEISRQAPAAVMEKQIAFYDELMAKTAVPETARERVRAIWRGKKH